MTNRPSMSPGENQGQRGGFFARYWAHRFHAMLDQMDAGMLRGSVQGSLPDGSRRMLGGRGDGPVAEMNIRKWRALGRIAWSGSVGLYEAWAAGDWDSPDPVQIFALFMLNRNTISDHARARPVMRMIGRSLHRLRRNSKAGSKRNIEFHYDLGNDFYSAWLDESMTYSSALFDESFIEGQDLCAAQARKNAALLARLHLKSGEHLLEIGCGWGGLAEQALRAQNVAYHGITLSHTQKSYADARLQGMDATITLTDYRDVMSQYDAIASVEMVEAVGQEYWGDYLTCIARNLKSGGRAAIQFISIADDIFPSYARGVDFIQRYIFPGGMLLSQSRFRALAEERGLMWQDQTDFGLHYAETLLQWRARFDDAVAEGKLPATFDDKFIRLWRFYLMYCEGGFRGGGINVAQVTLIKK